MFHLRLGNLLLLTCPLLASAGCFSFGGRTTVVEEKPETLGRIASLEARVGALEQALSVRAIDPQQPPLPLGTP